MRASSGASGSRKGASAGISDIPPLLSRIVALVVAVTAIAPETLADAPPAKNACVAVRAEAPYRGSGYDHLVKLHNLCDKPVKCHVSSDVNPEGANVTVAAKSHTEVLLWRGSPASTFKARVTCN